MANTLPFAICIVTGTVLFPKYSFKAFRSKVAMFPSLTKFVMENSRWVSPGTYMTLLSTACTLSPSSFNISTLIFPVIVHFIIWPSATSTPKFWPSTTSNKSARRGVMSSVAPLSATKFRKSHGSPISLAVGSCTRFPASA